MSGLRIIRRLLDLLDVNADSITNGETLVWDTATSKFVPGTGSAGAPSGADYLVGTAQGGLSAEIVVGTTPGGELGGTWASPTVDATHSGSSHASVQAAAEATASAALATHEADTTNVHGITDTSTLYRSGGTDVAVADGGTGASTASAARSNLGLGTIATQDANNVSISGGSVTGITDLAVADGGTGSSTAAGAATNLGLGTGDSPQFTAVNIGHATDTTVTRVSAGDIAVEGNAVYRAGGTDVPVADGGTGASTASGARDNLGLGTANTPQFTGVEVGNASDTTLARASAGDISVEGNRVFRVGGADVPLADGGTGSSLTDPNADRFMFWDDSAGAVDWLTPGAGLTISGTSVTDTITYETRSTNTILAGSDNSKTIDITAAITQTFTAAATLGSGWWVILRNNTSDGTTVLTLDPNSTETIDGLTTVTMYSGEARLIVCDGSNFKSVMLEGGYAKFTPGTSNFVVPYGIAQCDVVCIGAGGQGGGGPSSNATAKSGGSGGGGGAVSRAMIRASDLGAAGTTITVTVGSGGSGANHGTSAGNGTNGANGGNTTFGSLLKAGGGGGGLAGAAGNINGGGGGSTVAQAATNTAGAPASGAGAQALGSQGATPPSSGNTNGTSSDWGGAAGAGAATGTGAVAVGGSSIYGGPAGGSGGSCSTTVGVGGGAGGTTQTVTAGGGGGGGNGGASTTKGTDGTSLVGPFCGSGGGGGGGGSTGVAGKDGGVGGIGAGGGGGGVGLATGVNGGDGGAGGAGECRVWYE